MGPNPSVEIQETRAEKSSWDDPGGEGEIERNRSAEMTEGLR
jgi:hypothetical protein